MPKLDRRKVRTLKKLTEACIDMMLEIGYDRITVRSLARRAGVGSSTFYRHFTDKDDLLTRVSQEAMQAFRDALAPAQSPREGSGAVIRLRSPEPENHLSVRQPPA